MDGVGCASARRRSRSPAVGSFRAERSNRARPTSRRWLANAPRNWAYASRAATGSGRTARWPPGALGRAVLRFLAVRLLEGDVPRALEHTSMRWLAKDELDSVHWLPADKPIVAEL